MNRQAGFTLMEMVITMIILGILLSFAFFTWPGQGISAEAQTRQLASDLRYIRMLAMAKHDTYQINLSSSQYSFTESDGSTAVILPTQSGSNTVTLESGLTASYSNSTLLFDYEGIPYSSVGTALSSSATITITATDGSSNTLTITPETGFITFS